MGGADLRSGARVVAESLECLHGSQLLLTGQLRLIRSSLRALQPLSLRRVDIPREKIFASERFRLAIAHGIRRYLKHGNKEAACVHVLGEYTHASLQRQLPPHRLGLWTPH